jgi:DNA-binding transcriptional MerR regulator
MSFTVGELARLSGVTVRTLHHYDELGLVVASERSSGGYRLYSVADVLRLQDVLLLRELGLPLARIAQILDDPGYRRADALRQHRQALVARRGQLDAMIAAVDASLRLEEGHAMKPEDVKPLFDGFDPAAYAEEAEQRWGNTDAYRESARRTKKYGPAEWDAIRREADAIYARLGELMREGAPPTDPRVLAMVETHRAHIDRWFYPCSPAMHAGLAELYVSDPRFSANLDKIAPGFARFLHDAIVG